MAVQLSPSSVHNSACFVDGEKGKGSSFCNIVTYVSFTNRVEYMPGSKLKDS